MKPMLNKTSALEMAEALVRMKVGTKLKSVVFRSEDWIRPSDRPRCPLDWMQGRKVWADCVPEGVKGGMRCERGGTLGLNECWSEYGCIGCDVSDRPMTDWWERRCPRDEWESRVISLEGSAADSEKFREPDEL